MIYQILYFGAVIALVVSLLLITLLRKKQPRLSIKYWDFISIAAMFFGGFAFLSLLYHDVNLGQTPGDTITKIMLIVFPLVMIVFMIMYMVLYFWKGGVNSRIAEDERTEFNSTKSARNALLATNLALFIYLLNTETLTKSALLIVLFSGYFVFLASSFFYYYFKA
jgi:hypothetical protein